MKTDEQMTNEILSRVRKINKEKKKVTSAIVFLSAIIIFSAIAASYSDSKRKPVKDNYIISNNPRSSVETELRDTVYPNEQTTLFDSNEQTSTTTAKTTESSEAIILTTTASATVADGGTFSGGGFGADLSGVESFEVAITGDELSDIEAKQFLSENMTSIVSSLESSGVHCENIRFSEKGIYHINLPSEAGEKAELRQNFRDYLVFSSDKIAAIITLSKEDGKIYQTVAFGAPWFGEYGAFLERHKGQQLIFAYYGWLEAVFSPDGAITSPMGADLSEYFNEETDYYSMLYMRQYTYTP